MRDHHRIHPRADRRVERREFNRLQSFYVAAHACHVEVGVGGRISMAGKMFCRDQHPGRMRPFDISVNECAYLLGIFAEGTRINDRIIRI